MNKKTTTPPTPTTNALFEGMKLIQANKKGGGKEAIKKLTYNELKILYADCNLTAAAIAKLYQININTLKAYIQDSGIKKHKKYK